MFYTVQRIEGARVSWSSRAISISSHGCFQALEERIFPRPSKLYFTSCKRNTTRKADHECEPKQFPFLSLSSVCMLFCLTLLQGRSQRCSRSKASRGLVGVEIGLTRFSCKWQWSQMHVSTSRKHAHVPKGSTNSLCSIISRNSLV